MRQIDQFTKNLRGVAFLRRPWRGYAIAAALFAILALIPLPGFSTEAQRAIAVFGFAAFSWGANIMPLPVTAIFVLLLLPASGAISHEQTYANFGNRAVFFILGAFVLSSPIMRSGLSSRLALSVVSRCGHSVPTLIAGILGLGATFSCIISAHAVAAMLFPIVLEVVRATGSKPGSRFGLGAFMAMAWGVVIGSNTTLLGGARGPLALGILTKTTGDSIEFLQWTLWTIPVVLIMLGVAYLLLLRVVGHETVSLRTAFRFLEARNRRLGTISEREILTAIIMGITVILWLTVGDSWGLDTVAFIGVAATFLIGVADWQEVQEDVNWGIFMMYGSAIALSGALRDTGAASALTEQLLSQSLGAKFILFAVVILITTLMTEFMSNAAAVAVVMPVALALAGDAGIDPRAMTMGVAVSSGLGFMLPVSTPAIAMAVSSGFVRPLDVLRWGVWLDIVGYIVFLTTVQLYWSLVGLRL